MSIGWNSMVQYQYWYTNRHQREALLILARFLTALPFLWLHVTYRNHKFNIIYRQDFARTAWKIKMHILYIKNNMILLDCRCENIRGLTGLHQLHRNKGNTYAHNRYRYFSNHKKEVYDWIKVRKRISFTVYAHKKMQKMPKGMSALLWLRRFSMVK
jgi:hypothetical protein